MPEPARHIPELSAQTYLVKLGRNLLDSLVKRFSNPETARRNRILLLLFIAGLLTILLLPTQNLSFTDYKAGDIATSDVRATAEYLLEDKELTRQLQQEAEKRAPIVYTLSSKVPSALMEGISSGLNGISHEHNGKGVSAAERRKILEQSLDTKLSDAEFALFLRLSGNDRFLHELQQILEELYRQRIVLDAKVFSADMARGVELHDVNNAAIGTVTAESRYIEIGEARRILLSRTVSSVGRENSAILMNLVARLLKPNLFFDREATDTLKNAAVNGVKPVLYKLQKGEMIVRTGDRINLEQAKKLTMLQEATSDGGTISTATGIFLLVCVMIYLPYRFACKNIRKFNLTNRDLLAICLLVTGNILTFKLALIISANIGNAFPGIHLTSYVYLFPFAAGAMTVRILLNSEVALVYCVMMAPLLGMLFNSNMFVVIYALLGSVIGAHSVRQCQDRSVIYSAGFKLAAVNLAAVVCFQAMGGALLTVQTLYVLLFAMLGALTSSMLVSAFVPLFESLFHYTTDIKLLELANLNSPLLRDLMVKAPGTYHHSVVVGNLVEAAAEAIGANPLLARVAAYYHDIGKTAKPLYFVENIQGGENRHDRLSPHMSALILISHVKEGEALAKEKRLGQPITDIIRQHHGTALIRFFYEKARQQAVTSGLQVDVEEQEFRYPGPKPQTREAGLVMLADAVEAASRTLVNPTPDRIQGMVQKLINRIFSDGQLDECELTLKNLHEIAKSFNRILSAIFHHRIEYPEPVHKGAAGGKKTNAHHGTEPATKAPGTATSAQAGGGEDLKRLGMS